MLLHETSAGKAKLCESRLSKYWAIAPNRISVRSSIGGGLSVSLNLAPLSLHMYAGAEGQSVTAALE